MSNGAGGLYIDDGETVTLYVEEPVNEGAESPAEQKPEAPLPEDGA